MRGDNYFFVDGSALIADVASYKRDNALDPDVKLSLTSFATYFTEAFPQLTGFGYRRFVFYFAKGDKRVENIFVLPDFTKPDGIEDLRIEWCGKRLPKNEKAAKWLSERDAPPFVMDKLHRSEKAVDTQICCDALQLVAQGAMGRLCLYTNDSDFIPLCRTFRQSGCNISLFRLVSKGVNKALVGEVDTFSVMTEIQLNDCFMGKGKEVSSISSKGGLKQ